MLLNLSDQNADLIALEQFHCVFDDCLKNSYQNKDILRLALELLNKVIDATTSNTKFLNSLEKCVRKKNVVPLLLWNTKTIF